MSMKFITSTDLKLWACTKECQQLLPELVKKLIDASVTHIDKLSFPTGDATFLPGWDGILDCKENIDLVPSGISLWEFGTTESVKSKIDDDFNKRNENPLGYNKKDSTFVFVTPRIWEGAEEWLHTHKGDWKKIVIYTAIELERWIDKTPVVGMWLAQKLNKLPSGGYTLPETYWGKWTQGQDYKLPYNILLHGRNDAQEKIVKTCRNGGVLILQSLSQNEGIAFAIATLSTHENGSDILINRTVVVTDKHALEDLVEHYDNLIILTNLSEGCFYSAKRGHSIIVASTPADIKKEFIQLPIIEKEGFISSLISIGIDGAKARKIAKDTARDINILRRRFSIDINGPKWLDRLTDLLPAILVGKWNETVEGDKKIIEQLSGMPYEQYAIKLQSFLAIEETPLIQIGSIWRIRSPYETIEYILMSRMLPNTILDKYRQICIDLIQDDDSDSIEQLNDDVLHYHKFNQKYSKDIKTGVYQNLCLLSILYNPDEGVLVQWVDETITLMLKNWSLSRFLSNREHLSILAEASPNSFLTFIEELPKNILDNIFTPHEYSFSLGGWNIFYTELLFALEILAWDENYINRVTALLLLFSNYENESNYANRPDRSLYNIYRFYLPQTYVSFENRLIILKQYTKQYQSEVYRLCVKICKSIDETIFEPNQHYRWRMFGKLESPNYITLPKVENIREVVNLMLQCCDYSTESISELIALSFEVNLRDFRTLILNAVSPHIKNIESAHVVADALRKEITRHKQFEGAKWALTAKDLSLYQELLDSIVFLNTLYKNAWLFDDTYVQLPYKRSNTKWILQKQDELRLKALEEIVNENGIEGIWDFIQMIKRPESLSHSIVTYFDDKLNNDILRKYKSKELTEDFTKSYLLELYRKDFSRYKIWAKGIIEFDKELIIVLYAPGYVKELAGIAENKGSDVKKRYWETISVGFWQKEHTEIIVKELISVNRYAEAIEIVSSNRESIQMPDEEVVQLLYNYIIKGSSYNRRCNMFYVTSLLNELDKSDNPKVIQLLIIIEFLLYEYLEHQMDVSKSRFTKELSHNPELMIQLVELAYLPDDRNTEESEEKLSENKIHLARHALHILNFSHNIVSFTNKDGRVDENYLTQYIERLYELAKERKRTEVINNVVGNILGDIPRDNNYPSQALCDIVENLNSDIVDRAIYIRIYNSRGTTSRAYNEGGDQERYLVSQFEVYKERSRLISPRMTKIFDYLIKDYKRIASKEDNEALIADLEY